ncbi:unnamed protein product, partial [Sphacelaria rigidula]
DATRGSDAVIKPKESDDGEEKKGRDIAESLSAAAASEEGSLIGVVAGNSGVGIVEGGPRDEGEEPRSSRDQQHAEPKGIPAKFLQAISADLSTRLDPK